MDYSFSMKQAGVVYKAWKQGKIEVEKHVINKIYEFADDGIKGWSGTCFNMNHAIQDAVSLIVKDRFEEAQRKIDYFASELRHYEWVQSKNAKALKELHAC